MTLSDRARRTAVSALALAATATAGFVAAAPAEAARGGGAPGSLTGYAFDTCAAPAQAVMDTWWQESPYAGVGVFIGGSNRLCAQPELTAGWVATQLRTGWHVLPLWVGPQASCSGYADKMAADRPTAHQQGRDQAVVAIGAARGLGIGAGSTLYYDLEDYDITQTDCRQAALDFIGGWTDALHESGYRSGVYSNIAAAITSLDLADRLSAGSYSMPDDIWFAWANGAADTRTDSRVLSTRWDDHERVHQYALDITESHGGYTLAVDANWVDVGTGSVAKAPKPLCRGVRTDLARYPTLRPGRRGPSVAVAQCLLRRQHLLRTPITEKFDSRTVVAVKKAQRKLGLRPTGVVTRATWTGLLARGSRPVLKVGSTGPDVARLQRALTAAVKTTPIDGVYSTKTARVVTKLQKKHGLTQTGVVTREVWDVLDQDR